MLRLAAVPWHIAFAQLLLLVPIAASAVADASDQDGGTPKVFALVSAFGDRLAYVQNIHETGSRMEPYRRRDLKVSGHTLDALVLRGLDAELSRQHPSSRRVYLAVPPKALHHALPNEREEVAIQAALRVVKNMPERAGWYEIIIVTPRYVHGPSQGMAGRLNGAGVYVRPPLGQTLLVGGGSGGAERSLDPDSLGSPKETVVTPDGREHQSREFIAVYMYAKLWRFDARTLELISSVISHETLKLNDPASDSVHYARSIAAGFLFEKLSLLVEQTTAASLRKATLGVTVTDLEVVEGEAKDQFEERKQSGK